MENVELTKRFLLVEGDQIDISTEDKYIIGTYALASCIGFVLHSKDMKKAIVGHVSSGQLMHNEQVSNLSFQLSTLLEQGDLRDVPLDLIIIEGAFPSTYVIHSYDLEILDIFGKSTYTLPEVLEEIIKKTDHTNVVSTRFNNDKVSTNEVHVVDDCMGYSYMDKSKQFAFDTKSGTFVTDKVYFGKEYFEINNSNIK